MTNEPVQPGGGVAPCREVTDVLNEWAKKGWALHTMTASQRETNEHQQFSHDLFITFVRG